MDLSKISNQYLLGEFEEKDADKNPFVQFGKWFEIALNSEIKEPTAMVLATSTKDCKPSLRVVLLKSYSEAGFTFCTNYQSRKGKELKENPYASILFFWAELERQIRIEGTVMKTSAEESKRIFDARPKESRIGALASNQSCEIPDRNFLESRYKELEEKYLSTDPELPAFWGGYTLIPNYFEFWQGRKSRLHDRIAYSIVPTGWKISRLSP
jgi:pyridoxamine 5'-phosphate oxidase